MFSKTGNLPRRSAAWRICLGSGLAFAIGTAVAFWFLQSFLAQDIQNRADSWLSGELAVLADVAQRTPDTRLHDVVIREVAELASREVPQAEDSAGAMDREVFFVQTAHDGSLKLHTGAGSGQDNVVALRQSGLRLNTPANVYLQGFALPFRVVAMQLPNGDRISLALSTRYERKVLHRLRLEFACLYVAIIGLGTLIVFISAKAVLHRVEIISETAALIGRTNLSSRVPIGGRDDEIARLSLTLNQMFDRVESAVQQLHTMSDSLAHDLRSPLTSIRGKLELALMNRDPRQQEEVMISTIEELDRLSMLLATSLDVSEAGADALRLRKETVDLDQTVRALTELYEPSFAHAGFQLVVKGSGPLLIQADPALMQRTITNLFDNELKHLSPGSTVTVSTLRQDGTAQLSIEDNGQGFPAGLLPALFERYVKGPNSNGHGLGLAFVAAVVKSHNGTLTARNGEGGGASILIELPASA